MAVATLVANFLSFGGSLGTTKFCPQRKRRGRLFSTTAAAATLIRNAQEATEELLIVVGGGAAGVFAAIRSKTIAPHLRVMVVEKGRLLSKVKVSGGGRCNVTNGHSVDRLVLAEHYPRGNKELRGSFFNLHGPRDTISWFSDHGVELKTEDDGRVFPVSNSSSSIIDCLLLKAKSNGGSLASTQFGVTRARDVGGVLLTWEILVGLMLAAAANNGSTTSSFFSTGKTVTSASCTASGKFILKIEKRSVDFVEDIEADYLLIASGSSCQGHAIAVQLGHSIIQPMPSLFTFKIEDPRLLELSGVTLPKVKAKLKIPEASRNIPQYTQVGPMLVTHWGLSGPIILRLSAWGARDLYNSNYKGILFVDFVPDLHIEYVKDILIQHKNQLGFQKEVEMISPDSGRIVLVSNPSRFLSNAEYCS